MAVGTTAKDLQKLYSRILELTDGVEPWSQAILSVKKEVKGTRLELMLTDLLTSLKPPDHLVKDNVSLCQAGSTRKRAASVSSAFRSNRHDHKSFVLLDDTVSQLDSVILHLEQNDYSSIVVDQLKTIRSHYTQFRDALRTREKALRKTMKGASRKRSKTASRSALAVEAMPEEVPTIALARRGTFFLKAEVTDDVLPMTIAGMLLRTNASGGHIVSSAGGIHFKFASTGGTTGMEALVGSYPGIEYAVDSLNKLISSQGSPPSTLLSLSRGGKRYLALATETIEGATLEEKLGHVRVTTLVGITKGALGSMPLDRKGARGLWQRLVDTGVLTTGGLVLWEKTPLVDTKLDLGEFYADYAGTLTEKLRDIHAGALDTLHNIPFENFCFVALLSLLTNPADGKLDNYILQDSKSRIKATPLSSQSMPIRRGKSRPAIDKSYLDAGGTTSSAGSGRLVCIDNEESFVDSLLGLSTGHIIGIKQVLFFMPQMHTPIHPSVRKTLEDMQPATVVIEWLKDLCRKNDDYLSMVEDGIMTEAELEQLNLPVCLLPDCADAVYSKLCVMQQFVMEKRETSLFDLFTATQPLAAMYYSKLAERSPSPADPVTTLQYAFEALFSPRTPLVEDLFLDDLDKLELLNYEFEKQNPLRSASGKQSRRDSTLLFRSCSMKSVLDLIPKWRDYVRDRTMLPRDVLNSWVSDPSRFANMGGLEEEGAALTALFGSAVTELALHECGGLDDAKLITLVQTCKNLESLTLQECSRVTEKAVYRMAVEGWMPDSIEVTLVRCPLISERCRQDVALQNSHINIVLSAGDTLAVPGSGGGGKPKSRIRSALSLIKQQGGGVEALVKLSDTVVQSQREEMHQERARLDKAWAKLKRQYIQQELLVQRQLLDRASVSNRRADLHIAKWKLRFSIASIKVALFACEHRRAGCSLNAEAPGDSLLVTDESVISLESGVGRVCEELCAEYPTIREEVGETASIPIVSLSVPSAVCDGQRSPRGEGEKGAAKAFLVKLSQDELEQRLHKAGELATALSRWLAAKLDGIGSEEEIGQTLPPPDNSSGGQAQALSAAHGREEVHEREQAHLERREQVLREKRAQFLLDALELEEHRQAALLEQKAALDEEKARLQIQEEELDRNRLKTEQERSKMERERLRLAMAQAEMEMKALELEQLKKQVEEGGGKEEEVAQLKAELEAMKTEAEGAMLKKDQAEAKVKEMEEELKSMETALSFRKDNISFAKDALDSASLSGAVLGSIIRSKPSRGARMRRPKGGKARKNTNAAKREVAKYKAQVEQMKKALAAEELRRAKQKEAKAAGAAPFAVRTLDRLSAPDDHVSKGTVDILHDAMDLFPTMFEVLQAALKAMHRLATSGEQPRSVLIAEGALSRIERSMSTNSDSKELQRLGKAALKALDHPSARGKKKDKQRKKGFGGAKTKSSTVARRPRKDSSNTSIAVEKRETIGARCQVRAVVAQKQA